jgi:AbrB family looped-hinge helix DNA binding protein
MSTKGQIILPAEIRALDRIEPGEEFVVERVRVGQYRLTRARRQNRGLVELLLGCPVKGWFTAPGRSETTDSIIVPRVG